MMFLLFWVSSSWVKWHMKQPNDVITNRIRYTKCVIVTFYSFTVIVLLISCDLFFVSFSFSISLQFACKQQIWPWQWRGLQLYESCTATRQFNRFCWSRQWISVCIRRTPGVRCQWNFCRSARRQAMVANQFFHITTNSIWHMGRCFHIGTDQYIRCHCVSYSNTYQILCRPIPFGNYPPIWLSFQLDFCVPVLLLHKLAFLMEFWSSLLRSVWHWSVY